VRDLQDLPPKEARELLALAAATLQARAAQRPAMIRVHLVGPITQESMREVARGLLEEKRRAAGREPVDLDDLRICDDWRLRKERADSVTGMTAAELAECLAPKGLATK
jgi:hypothetical protein